MKSLFALVSFLAACSRCTPTPAPQPPQPPAPLPAPAPDSGVYIDGGNYVPACWNLPDHCAGICCHLGELRCSAATSQPKCIAVCNALASDSHAKAWDYQTCMTATSCGQCK